VLLPLTAQVTEDPSSTDTASEQQELLPLTQEA
jgi:hypothetical protein